MPVGSGAAAAKLAAAPAGAPGVMIVRWTWTVTVADAWSTAPPEPTAAAVSVATPPAMPLAVNVASPVVASTATAPSASSVGVQVPVASGTCWPFRWTARSEKTCAGVLPSIELRVADGGLTTRPTTSVGLPASLATPPPAPAPPSAEASDPASLPPPPTPPEPEGLPLEHATKRNRSPAWYPWRRIRRTYHERDALQGARAAALLHEGEPPSPHDSS